MIKPLKKLMRNDTDLVAGLRKELNPYLGASLLSSIGSLPLHLSPLIISAVVADSYATIAMAGWITTALVIGQLFTSLLLPSFQIRRVRPPVLILVAFMFLAGVLVSGLGNFAWILLGWFCVGLCCGILKFFGTMAAVEFPCRPFAFSLRLAFILVLAGLVTAILLMTNAFTSYQSLSSNLIVVLVPLLTFGILLHRSGEARPVEQNPPPEKRERWSRAQLTGLLTIYLFFVGQVGFFAFVIQQALERGMSLYASIWTLALVKFLGGIVLVYFSIGEIKKPEGRPLIYIAVPLILAILMLSKTDNIALFFLGLFVFELAINPLSAKIQSEVVSNAPQLTGSWLTGIILLGSASGPPLHGLALAYGYGNLFVLFAVISALLPYIWQRSKPGVYAVASGVRN